MSFTLETPSVIAGDSIDVTPVAMGDGRLVFLYGTSFVATAVVGDSDADGALTFGTPVSHTPSGSVVQRSLCKAGSDKVLLVYYDGSTDYYAVVGTLTGTALSWGTRVQFNISAGAAGGASTACAYDPVNDKVLVWCGGEARVGTISGSSVAFGSPATPTTTVSGSFGFDGGVVLSYDTSSGNFLWAGTCWCNLYGGYEDEWLTAVAVASISGTTVSFGTAVELQNELPYTYARIDEPLFAYDSVNSVHFLTGQASTSSPATYSYDDASVAVAISGTTVSVNSGDLVPVTDGPGYNWPVAYDPSSRQFVVVALDAYDSMNFKTGDIVAGDIVWADDNTDNQYTIESFTTTYAVYEPENDWVHVVYQLGSNSYTLPIRNTIPQEPICYIKPVTEIETAPADPGSPGYPGQPYVPAYCLPPYCYEVAINVSPAGGFDGGNYVSNCKTYPAEGIGFGEYETLCTVTFVPGGGGGVISLPPGIQTYTICNEPVCYPAQPYIAPTPAVAPTQAEYMIEYNLGWTYDVVLGTVTDLAMDISVDNVARDTAGVVIGVAEQAEAHLEGLGKYVAYLLFVGDRVGFYVDHTLVWGQVYRAADEVFTLQQSGTQVAALRDGEVLYTAEVFSGGNAVIVGTIYKGGEKICVLYPPTDSGALLIGTASGEILLPPVLALGGLYAQADLLLPVPTLEAYGYGHGGADIDLPAVFGIGAEGSFGWSMARLPVPQAVGYEGAAGISHANLALPALGMLGGEGAYAIGDVTLPGLGAEGTGGFPIPASSGADLRLPHVMLGAHGFTGTVGGANLTLPGVLALAGEGTYGEVDMTLPVVSTFAGELPDYDGVLYGQIGELGVVDFWGYANAPDAINGRLGPLTGALYGGADLDAALAPLTGTLTGTLAAVGRLSGTIGTLAGALHAVPNAIGTLAGPLDLTLRGELLGGGVLAGELPALRGESDGTLDTVGSLNGSFVLGGSLTGTAENFGHISGSLGELGALWGVLDGVIVALDGELVGSAVTVAEYAAWVMNLAHNGLSRYPAYPFDFVVRWQGRHYLANSAGLYLLGGDNDDGANINAGFALPESDYGTAYEKRVPRFYFKGKVAGEMAVMASVDEGDRVARHSDGHEGVDYWRVRLPRGLEGHHWQFEVANVDGADFEIEQTDVLIHKTGRKL